MRFLNDFGEWKAAGSRSSRPLDQEHADLELNPLVEARKSARKGDGIELTSLGLLLHNDKVDPTIADNHGPTALHIAAKSGLPENLRILADGRIDMNFEDKRRKMALDLILELWLYKEVDGSAVHRAVNTDLYSYEQRRIYKWSGTVQACAEDALECLYLLAAARVFSELRETVPHEMYGNGLRWSMGGNIFD